VNIFFGGLANHSNAAIVCHATSFFQDCVCGVRARSLKKLRLPSERIKLTTSADNRRTFSEKTVNTSLGNPPSGERGSEVEFSQLEEFYMKKSRFTDSQIMDALKRAEAGFKVPDLCRELGISSALFYRWRAKFGGMDASMMSRMKELEEENRRLRKMIVDERLKAEIVQEALAKKW
jgi:putative transposase